MAIQLKKGQKIDLTKGNPGLKHIRLGLGWDTNMFDGGDDFDLDVSLFMVGKSGKVEQDEDFIFYNNLKHPSEAVEHLGDNRTGDGDGDDEELEDQGQPGHDDRVAEPLEEIVELVVEQGLEVGKGEIFGDDLERRGKNVSAGLKGRGDHKNEGIDAAQTHNKRDGCDDDLNDGFVFLGSHGNASFTGLPTFSGRATGSA